MREDYLRQGLTPEQAAEFDSEETIAGIENALARLDFVPQRIGNIKALIGCLAGGESWDIVFNIAEGWLGPARESQVPAVLEAYGIPYTFSDSFVLAVCLNKAMTKRVIRDAGVPTPDFAVIETPDDLTNVELAFPLFAKPVSEGTGKGITSASRIERRSDLGPVCTDIMSAFHQPILLENYLPGREFTVGIIGTGRQAHVCGAMEVQFKTDLHDIYSYHAKSHYEDLVAYRLAEEAVVRRLEPPALAAWRALGCRDAGRMDFRLDRNGRPHFIEVNPLAGLNPVHSDLPILCRMKGIQYDQLIERIMQSAFRRHSDGFRAHRSRGT